MDGPQRKSLLFIRIALLFLFFIPLSFCLTAQSFHLLKANRYRDKQRHGLWITYWNDSIKNVMSRGRYKLGNEKGVWKYYYQFGTLARKEVYRWKRIKTTEYYENGTVERKGYAKLDEGAKGLHYYWYGAWKIYDREGKLVKVVNYEKGVIVQETALLETDP